MEIEKNPGQSKEEIKIPKEENNMPSQSKQADRNLSEANEMKEREKYLIGEGINPKIKLERRMNF